MSQPSHPYPALNTLIGINRLCAILSFAAGAIGLVVALVSSDLQTGMISVLGALIASVSFIASAELIELLLRAKAELTVDGATIALARGRLEEHALSEVRDIFVADADGRGIAASRLLFGPDEALYMTVGGAISATGDGQGAQDPANHVGKLLRLTDDGSARDDNPFVGRDGYKPELFSMGHRNQLGLAFHPDTDELWASENAPMGGDEVNIITAGKNYGWPVVSYSREYYGPRVSERPWREDMEQPEIVWIPSIAPSGLMFYTGDRFPAWKGNLFVGSLTTGRVHRTGHLERVAFNRQGMEQRREWLLGDLKQRIRDVRQGPDGLIYVLTDGAYLGDPTARDAALLRIEPVD